MKKRLLCVFGVLVFIGAALFAQEDVVVDGWLSCGPGDFDRFNPTNSLIVPDFVVQDVLTNCHFEAGLSAQTDGAISLDLPATLPQSDFARIRELARGLDHDWRKCYYFVRDNIGFAPYFGIMRGPERTLLDREGNDLDQSFLLLALLRASGHTATIVFEPLAVSSSGAVTSGFYVPLHSHGGDYPYNAASWLGVDETGTVASIYEKVAATFSCAAYEVKQFTTSSGVECIGLTHFWVAVQTESGWYFLDPSFKPVVKTAGRDAASDMAYVSTTTTPFVGGVSVENGIRSLSRTNIDSKLKSYCSTLRASWTNENASISDYVRDAAISPQTDTRYFRRPLSMNSPRSPTPIKINSVPRRRFSTGICSGSSIWTRSARAVSGFLMRPRRLHIPRPSSGLTTPFSPPNRRAPPHSRSRWGSASATSPRQAWHTILSRVLRHMSIRFQSALEAMPGAACAHGPPRRFRSCGRRGLRIRMCD